MKKTIAAAVLTAGLVLAPLSAQAGGYKYRYHHGHHGHHYGGALAVAGIIGGAIVLSSLLTAPRYYHPPAPAYSAPPARNCVRDDVYRYLPDGRKQWGVRTRCY